MAFQNRTVLGLRFFVVTPDFNEVVTPCTRPEEPLMSPLTNPLPNRFARILPHKLANHCLRDRLDDRGVRRLALTSVVNGDIGIGREALTLLIARGVISADLCDAVKR
jgi:hypothetical protein